MKKLETWGCSEGCDVSKKPCPHLEKFLPQPMDGDFPQRVGDAVVSQMTVSVFDIQFPKHDGDRFIELMRNYGFVNKWDLDLLEAYFYRNLSMREIAEEFNWVSTSTIQRHLKSIKLELIKRGFRQELE